jgi:hypothetical protein
MERAEPATLADATEWLAAEGESDCVEVTLADANTHTLLLPIGLPAQRAVGILIGSREPDDDSPWPPGEWLETETACWIRRSAIVSVRIVTRPKTATA